jgi:DNA-binding response OmpR family regulator
MSRSTPSEKSDKDDGDTDKCVLIVEDEQSIAALHAHHLSDTYETRVAHTGGEAMVELTPEVDLVLLDRRMPGMSGDEFLEHIKNDWHSDCEVIMVTAIDPDMEIIDMPISGYLSKPVDKDELLRAVRQALLIDDYEELISEYYRKRKKYATLNTEYASPEITDDRFTELETELTELESEMNEMLRDVNNDEIREALRGMHQT